VDRRIAVTIIAVALAVMLITAELAVTQARRWEDWRSETYRVLSRGGYIAKRTTGDAKIVHGPFWWYPCIRYKNIPWLCCKELWCSYRATGGWWESGSIYIAHKETARFLPYYAHKTVVYMHNRGYDIRGRPYQALWLEATSWTKKMLRKWGVDKLLKALHATTIMVLGAAAVEEPAATMVAGWLYATFSRITHYHPWMIYVPLKYSLSGTGRRFYTISGGWNVFWMDFSRYGAPNFFRYKWACNFKGDTGMLWWKLGGTSVIGMRVGVAADPQNYTDIIGYANPIAVIRDIGIAYRDGEVVAGMATVIMVMGDADITIVRSEGYEKVIESKLINGTLIPILNTTYIGPNVTSIVLLSKLQCAKTGLNTFTVSLPAEVEAMVGGVPIKTPRLLSSGNVEFTRYETGPEPTDVYCYAEERTSVGHPGFNGTCITSIHLYGLEPVNVTGTQIIVATPSAAPAQFALDPWMVAGAVLIAVVALVAATRAFKHTLQEARKPKFVKRRTA